MSFASYAFLLLLLLVVALRMLCVWRGAWRAYHAVLALATLVFYAWPQPWHLVLLGYVCLVGYVGPGVIASTTVGSRRRRRAVSAVIVASLGPLFVYKYLDYLVSQVGMLASALGVPFSPPPLGLVLPLGISFFTFEVVSFALDVHRGRARPARRPLDVLLFVGFFPHLVAGPIVRAGEFLYQLPRRRRVRARVMAEGCYLLVRGFFLKLVIADNVGVVVDTHWQAASMPGANASLGSLLMLLFAAQIYCDFEGYTTIARGAAYLLGFRLPPNFNAPYIAGTFRNFWERWHMTLSRWLRDYLYVSLGGNRVGRVRMYVNLLLTMVLGGLWHGAANTFLVWGGLHGVALAVERRLGFHQMSTKRSVVLRVGWFVVVQGTVLIAWVFFRSPTVETAYGILGNVVGGVHHPITKVRGWPFPMVLAAVPLVAGHARTLARERWGVPDLSPTEKGLWGAIMLYAIATAYGPTTTFIYFQF